MNTGEIINLFCQTEEHGSGDCKPCRRCQFELKESDKFCRRCGWRQFDFVTGSIADGTVRNGQSIQQQP